jgi:hypothetical protein
MDCRYFDGCSAPLCPRDEGAADRAWFPDEDICRLADSPEWVKRQRKVSRKAAMGASFTLAMLKHDCRICAGMKGETVSKVEKRYNRFIPIKGIRDGIHQRREPSSNGTVAGQHRGLR